MSGEQERLQELREEWDSTEPFEETLDSETVEELIELADGSGIDLVKAATQLINDISAVDSRNFEQQIESIIKVIQNTDPESDWSEIDDLIKTIWHVAENSPQAAAPAEDLLFEYHTHNKPYRSTAANALPYLTQESDELIDSLINRMEDKSNANRKQSAYALMKIAEEFPDEAAPIVSMFHEMAEDTENNSDIRRHSLEGLAAYTEAHPSYEVEPDSMLSLAQDPRVEDRLRGAAVEVLASYAKTHPEELADRTEEFAELIEDDGPNVRRYSAAVFNHIAQEKPEALQPVLPQILSSCFDEYANARDRHLETLATLVDAEVINSDDISLNQDQLISLVEDDSAGTAAATLPSIKLLGIVADTKAIETLEKYTDPQPGISNTEAKEAEEAIEQIRSRV